MLITKEHITTIIPQKEPMVMIDNLIYCDHQQGQTNFQILSDNLFIEGENFSESGMIENIAQTAAAHMGYLCLKSNTKVPIGFIGAIKKLEILDLPKIGALIETTIHIENEILGVIILKGRIELRGKIIANLEMKIAVQKE